jgi:hypothetical protein
MSLCGRPQLIHRLLGSGKGILEHESGREGRILVDASDLGQQEGPNSVHIVRLRVTSPRNVRDMGGTLSRGSQDQFQKQRNPQYAFPSLSPC